MFIARFTALAGIVLAAAFLAVAPAQALTAKECSVKYQAAKEAGTLGDVKWNDFRKTECAADDQPAAKATKTKKAAAKADDDDQEKGLTSKQCSAKYQAAKEDGSLGDMKWNDFRKAECGPGATAKIEKAKVKKAAATSDDDAEKGLTVKECSTKYQAAKADGSLGDMKWNDFRKAECGPGSSVEVKSSKSTKAVAKAETSGGGLSMKECSAKYQTAKEDGSLGGLKWNSFRKAKCSADAADDDSVPAPTEAEYTNEPETPAVAAPRGVKFPRGIASKFSNESEGRARMHTCLEQYYVNKENNTLGGLKWIQKGGGYYSLCNTRLKPGA